MHRRDFMTGSTLAGVSSVALSGCTSSLGSPLVGRGEGLLLDPKEIEARWAEVETARAAILQRPPLKLDGVLAGGRSQGRVATGGELARKAVRSILMAGAFRDLPEEARAHPTVQDALFDAMPEIDEAVFGMKERIEALTSTERADIARELRRDPELAERVVGLLDDEAAATGVSDVRRLHMRKMGLSICARLHQSSELLIGEYHAKLEKVAAQRGSHAEIERRMAAAMGEQAFQAMRERTLRADEAYRSYEVAGARRKSDAHPVGGAFAVDPSGNGPGARIVHKSAKVRLLTAGGITLGIGVVLGAVGGILVASGQFAGAFVLTVAGLSVIAGLVVLIVGAAID